MTWKEIDAWAVRVAAQFLGGEAELVEAIRLVDRHRLFDRFGLTSTFAYCVQRLRLSEDQAYGIIRVVRKSEVVPALAQAVVEGTLTVSRAKKIASVVTPENHEEWIQKAVALPTADLERAVVAKNPREAVADRLRPVSDGFSEFRCMVDRETEALLREAQNIVSRSEKSSADMNKSLKAALLPFVKKHRPGRQSESPKDKPKVCAAIRDRKRVAVPEHIDRAVQKRDEERCTFVHPQFGRCQERRWTEQHHIIPISEGGQHSVENLITLCSVHHRLQHKATGPGPVPRGAVGS